MCVIRCNRYWRSGLNNPPHVYRCIDIFLSLGGEGSPAGVLIRQVVLPTAYICKGILYMAKGQQRGNREQKKPKQNKPKKVESNLSKVAATFENKLNPHPKKGGKK